MVTSIHRFSAVALLAVTLLTSCAKLPRQSKYIPANAVFVMDINTRQISNKLVSGGLSFDKLVSASEKATAASRGEDTNDSSRETSTAKAVKQAQKSGIDLTDHFFAAYVQDTIDNTKSYVSMIASLTDSSKFSSFLKATSPDAVSGKGSDFSYLYLPEEHTIIGWNADNAVSVTGINVSRMAAMGGALYPPLSGISGYNAGDTITDSAQAVLSDTTTVTPPPDTLEHFWAGRLEYLFHLKESERATSYASLKSALKQGTDLSIWINPTTLYKDEYILKLPGDFRKLFSDSYYTASLNFEDGKVVAASSAYINPTLDSILKKYNTNIDPDMLKNYPSNNITSFLLYGFDPRIIGDVLNALKVNDLVDTGMQSMLGISLSDALNAFNGQFVAVASDYAIVKKPAPWDSTEQFNETQVKWLFSAKVKDKAAFQRIMDSKNVSMFFTKDGDHYTFAIQNSKTFVADINLEHVSFASDAQLLAQYSAGKSGKVGDTFTNLVKGNTIGAYVNLNQLLGAVGTTTENDTTALAITKNAKDLFQDVVLDQYPVKDKVVKSAWVLNLKDKSKNSLASLVSFSLDAYQRISDANAKARAQWDVQQASDTSAAALDSAVMISPPPPMKKYHK
ncbi:hypothetical protein [Chitinophaga costaii]|nr:hypothetical protein [Chitinophaga costaii]